MANIYYLSKLGVFGIYISITVGLSVIVTVGFILTQTPVIRVLFNLEDSLRKQIIVGVFFGGVSIFGTYLGTDVNGAIANIRDVGAISGGLFGGPFVGLIAGLIGGVHRFSLRWIYCCSLCSCNNIKRYNSRHFVYNKTR